MPAPSTRSRPYNSAFGKVSYDPTSRLRTSFSVLWTPTTSSGTLPAYNGFAPNTISSTLASNEPQKTRGYKSPQTSYSGTVDYTLTDTSLLSFRGGYFDDNYMDTGIPQVSSVTYQAPNIGLPYGTPADLVGGIGFQNTPRVQFASMDHTKRGYADVDYIKAFTAGGNHNLKAGFGYQRTSNDVDNTYPGGGYVYIWWDKSFTSNVTGISDRGQYGYYEVNDFGTRGSAQCGHLVALRAGPVDGEPADAEPRRAHRERGDPLVPHRHQGQRVRVRVRRQDRAAPRRELRRPRRRPAEGVRQLGPLLRLDQVRAGARHLRRRHLAGLLPLARHARRLLAERHQPAGPEPVDERSEQLPRSSRAELRLGRSRTSSR